MKLHRSLALLLCLGSVLSAALAFAQDATETPSAGTLEEALDVEVTGEVTEAAATTEAAPTPEQVSPQGTGDLQALEIGTPVTGELTDAVPTRLYTFTVEEGDLLAITMESDELDPYLRLGNMQGSQLLEDDDSADQLNARIGPLMLPAGSYVIAASSFDTVVSRGAEVETGEYTLRIDRYEAESIRVPAQVSGELEADEPLVIYRFEANRGDVLFISLDSEDFDTLLTVSQADSPLAPSVTDDDSGPDRNSLIVPYIIPQSGSYFAVVGGVERGSEGEFILNIAPLPATAIAYGDALDTTLSRLTPVLVYSFEGEAGDVIDITVEAPAALDTTLTVLAPDGAQVAYNDDLIERNPGVQGLQLAEAGTYTIVVQPFVSGRYGDLRLSLTRQGS